MRGEIKSFVRRLHKDESGAVMVLVAISIAALLGVTALAIDVANLVYAQRRLQATTDMAAQAAALDLNCNGCTAATPVTTANTYSAVSGALNAQPNLNVTMVSGYPQLYCLQSTGIFYSSTTETCSSATSRHNAIEVQQQATVPLIFAQYFGLSSVTLTATALASAKNGALPPLHIMLVIDNTSSMTNRDPTSPTPTDCGITNPEKIHCALAGAQLLLNELWPTQDEVGLIVFPPLTSGSAADDASCSASPRPTPTTYGSGTYVVPVGGTASNPMVTNYKTSNTATTLNVASGNIAAATCQSGMTTAAATCGSCAGLKVIGDEGTYLGGAISKAQSILNSNSTPGVQNVMIVLSDGGAGNASSHGGPASNECVDSITYAGDAAAAGTWVYSIAYGSSTALSPNSNSCSDTETPKISSCTTMADIASDPTKFYSDPMGSGGSNNVGPVATYSLQPVNELTTNASTSRSGSTSNVLHFASTSTVQVGMGVQDVTAHDTTYIPAGTTVLATTATTVTLSKDVTTTIPSGDQIQFSISVAGSTVLYFTSGSTSTVQVGMGVQDATAGDTAYIPAGTTVTATTATTVTISNPVTTTIPPSDGIKFAYSFAGSTVLYFPSGQLSNVKVGMGVADNTNPTSVLAGTTVASVNTTANTVTINAGEGGIVNGTVHGVQPGDGIVFYPIGNCTSQYNPTPTDLVSIFAAIGQSLTYTQLLPLTCISSGANTC